MDNEKLFEQAPDGNVVEDGMSPSARRQALEEIMQRQRSRNQKFLDRRKKEIKHVENELNYDGYVALLRCERLLGLDKLFDALGVKWHKPDVEIAMVKSDPHRLKYVKNPTPELCATAVQVDPRAMRYVKKQTPEICMAAVRANPDALKYMRQPTPEVREAAGEGIRDNSVAAGTTMYNMVNGYERYTPRNARSVNRPRSLRPIRQHYQDTLGGTGNLEDLIGNARAQQAQVEKVHKAPVRESERSF